MVKAVVRVPLGYGTVAFKHILYSGVLPSTLTVEYFLQVLHSIYDSKWFDRHIDVLTCIFACLFVAPTTLPAARDSRSSLPSSCCPLRGRARFTTTVDGAGLFLVS